MTFSFVRVVALESGRAFVTASDDELDDYAPFTRVFEFDGAGWSRHRDYQFYIFSATRTRSIGSACGLGLGGDVAFFRDERPPEQIIPPVSADSADMRPGRFTCIREIGGELYAVGEGGRNFHRDGSGRWSALDASLIQKPFAKDWDREFFPADVWDDPSDPNGWGRGRRTNRYLIENPEIMRRRRAMAGTVQNDRTFFSINGTSQHDLFVGGSNNALMVWQPGQNRFGETLLEGSPDNEEMTVLDIGLSPDGTVYACGAKGLLLEGGRGGFESAVSLPGDAHLAAMAFFNGGHYLIDQLGKRGLWQFDGYRLSQVETGLSPEPGPLLSISASSDYLWAVGSKEIVRFDGTAWERISQPELK